MSKTAFPLGSQNMPEAPPLRKMIGPSFILLGLGLGSGEIVLWPAMASTYGLGIVWGILVGVTMQFFINMEVERYALVMGESIFVGFARLFRWLPGWFILSTFLGFGWPGIGLYGATLLDSAFGIGHPNLVGVVLFLGIGAILTLGSVLYRTVERLQKVLIGIGVPLIVGLTFWLVDAGDLLELANGLVGVGVANGEAYLFLPQGIAIGAFLGALAYAGAGGNLNLAQSFYVRDKGYGMGAYASRITSLITARGAQEEFSLTGNTFPPDVTNLARYRRWWKVVNREHALIFWGLGLFTMLTLSLLAAVTIHGTEETSILLVVQEAAAIGARTLPVIGFGFLLLTGIMLAATQLTVLDSTSRIITENLLLFRGCTHANVSRLYYIVLWSQIFFGITVFLIGFDQPLTLIILGAIINAFSMFVYTGLLLWANRTLLHPATRPTKWRVLILLATFFFLGAFCVMTLLEKLG